MLLNVYDINPNFETEAKQNCISFCTSYFYNQNCSLTFALSIIAMLKFSVYVPKRAPVISLCPNTKTKNLMEIC